MQLAKTRPNKHDPSTCGTTFLEDAATLDPEPIQDYQVSYLCHHWHLPSRFGNVALVPNQDLCTPTRHCLHRQSLLKSWRPPAITQPQTLRCLRDRDLDFSSVDQSLPTRQHSPSRVNQTCRVCPCKVKHLFFLVCLPRPLLPCNNMRSTTTQLPRPARTPSIIQQ